MIVALLAPLCFCMTTEPTRTAAKRRSRIPEMARIFPRTDIEGLLPMNLVKMEKREGMSMERGGRIFQAFQMEPEVSGLIPIRVLFPRAICTDSMRELCVRIGAEIVLDSSPIAFVIAHTLAGRANGEQSAQRFHVRQGLLKFQDKLLLFFFHMLAPDSLTDLAAQ